VGRDSHRTHGPLTPRNSGPTYSPPGTQCRQGLLSQQDLILVHMLAERNLPVSTLDTVIRSLVEGAANEAQEGESRAVLVEHSTNTTYDELPPYEG
jgi:hypothetical protein